MSVVVLGAEVVFDVGSHSIFVDTLDPHCVHLTLCDMTRSYVCV